VPIDATGKFLPARMVTFFRQALQESIGLTAAERLWISAGPPDACPPPAGEDLAKSVDFSWYAGLCASVAGIYGEAGARAILYRCGRTAFARLLRSTSAIAGLNGPRFAARSEPERIAEGLRSAAWLLGQLSDLACRVETGPQEIRFHTADCPECVGRTRGGSLCHGMAGAFRGILDWFGIDPEIPVVETECGMSGCTFSVTTGC
jgi:predicted hydrocarbon binding protein